MKAKMYIAISEVLKKDLGMIFKFDTHIDFVNTLLKYLSPREIKLLVTNKLLIFKKKKVKLSNFTKFDKKNSSFRKNKNRWRCKSILFIDEKET